MDAGHCYAGRSNSGNATLFATKFINAQCRWWCNLQNNGEPKKYEKALAKRHGKDYVERWKYRLKNKVIKNSSIDWKRKAKQFEARTNILLRKYGHKTLGEVLKELAINRD